MEAFVVSARKYRPVTFDSVVGQESVTRTLKNAIKSGQLGQSFLFTGPRGVGKTTCARILAKAINCESLGPETEPCNECSSCKSFNEAASYNIFELDAASNSSVEDIRALIEQVRYAPQSGKYKVYIIDEVHMLSSSAFNAFLKTLEEPPSYAIFILATTEKHKILPTILSRCQIYDFSRILPSDIVTSLGIISKKEGVNAEEDALHLIAEKADGAMRDALSIFDRLNSFSSKELTYAGVVEGLNILDYDWYFKVSEALAHEDISEALLLFNEILRNGFEGDLFMAGLGSHFRNLLVAKNERTLSLLEGSDNLKKRYKSQATELSETFILNALQLSADCDAGYRLARNKSLQVESYLIRMAYINQTVELVKNPQSAAKKKRVTPSEVSEDSEIQTDKITPNVESVPKPELTPEQELTQVPTKVKELVVDENNKTDKTENDTEGATQLASSPKLSSLDSLTSEIANTSEQAQQDSDEEELRFVDKSIQLNKEQVLNSWKLFAHQLKDLSKMSLYALMDHMEPEIDGHRVIVKVENVMQEAAFIEERMDLLEFIEMESGQAGIELAIEIDSSIVTKGPDKPVTIKDKYNVMKEKNPKLEELQDRLDLDLDY